MVVSIKTYEQYCVHLNRNIIIEEKLYAGGKKELKCLNKPMCEKCRNKILAENENIYF